MLKKIVILFFLIFCAIISGVQEANTAESEKQINSFHDFLKTNVDPIIWYIYEEIHGLIDGDQDPQESILSKHRILDLNSKFLENSSAGSIFVITGTVKFLTDSNIDECKVTAKLFALEQKPIQTEIVSCGNQLSEDELATLDVSDIKKRLSVSGKRPLSLKKNDVVPFMVVFSHFPKEQLERFTIEINEISNSAEK